MLPNARPLHSPDSSFFLSMPHARHHAVPGLFAILCPFIWQAFLDPSAGGGRGTALSGLFDEVTLTKKILSVFFR